MARKSMPFAGKLIAKLKQQIHSQRVGFLLGAGSSYLDGNGYPLASTLWEEVKSELQKADRDAIQDQFDSGCTGLEEALDRLDDGAHGNFQLRHRVASAIAETFRAVNPPLEHHRTFVRGLSQRLERRIPVFSLNYDPIIERASDEERLLLNDGFCGSGNAFFLPESFTYQLGFPATRKGKSVIDPKRGTIDLYKLHGSMGWFLDSSEHARRGRADCPVPAGTQLLMIPPHHRKGQDTGSPPYSDLWSEFRALLTNDKRRLLNRLICVGYGLRDTHVNPILQAARGRPNFTMIILAKTLRTEEYSHWKQHKNVIIATETSCSFFGEEGPGIPEVWSFEWLAKEVNKNA